MKVCPHCNVQLEDDVVFCPACGQNTNPQPAAPRRQASYSSRSSRVPYDHTHEFTRKDISDNKVIAMLVYLLGPVGILIALLASTNSPYVAFHLRQALKITVVETLMPIAALLLSCTVILAFVALPAWGILTIAFFVIRIISFFQICSGKAVEPAIIRNLDFLK